MSRRLGLEQLTTLPSSLRQPILAGLEGVTASAAFEGMAHQTFEATARLSTCWRSRRPEVPVPPPPPHQGQEPTSWFAAFGPVSDPRYVVGAVVDQGGYGADGSAPAVKQTLQWWETDPVAPVNLPGRATRGPTLPHPATRPAAPSRPPPRSRPPRRGTATSPAGAATPAG